MASARDRRADRAAGAAVEVDVLAGRPHEIPAELVRAGRLLASVG